jgi:hypothetical protein
LAAYLPAFGRSKARTLTGARRAMLMTARAAPVKEPSREQSRWLFSWLPARSLRGTRRAAFGGHARVSGEHFDRPQRRKFGYVGDRICR